MNDIEAVLERAQERLNIALLEYENENSTLARDFHQLKMQALMFQVHPGFLWVVDAGYRSSPPQWK